MKIKLPIRIVSEANVREHWSKKAKRVKVHNAAAMAIPAALLRLPCVVTLTRIAPRPLDEHDNLRSGFKALVDGIADRLGVKDNDPRIEWRYAQARGAAKEYAAGVEIEHVAVTA